MTTAKITRCKHFFHGVCLRKWLYVQDRCPLCHEIIMEVMNQEDGGAVEESPPAGGVGGGGGVGTGATVAAAAAAAVAAGGGGSRASSENPTGHVLGSGVGVGGGTTENETGFLNVRRGEVR